MPRPIQLDRYRRSLRFVRPYALRLALVTLIGMAGTAAGLAQPYLSKLLIDRALLARDMRALVWIAAWIAALAVLGFALNIVSSYQYVRISANLLFDMRLELYRHLQALSPRFWAKNRLGDVVSRINNDVAEVQRIAADTLLAVCSNLVFLAGAAAIMVWVSPRVFLLSAAALPPSVWALRRFQSRLATQARAMRDRSATIGSFLIETLTGFRLVATSNAQETEIARFRRYNQGFIQALLAMQWTSFLAAALPGAILTGATAGIFLYGGKLVIDGRLTTGSLVALMAYHMRLLAPIQNLMGLYTNLIVGGASLARFFEVIDQPIEVRDPAQPVGISQASGAIELDEVTFRYDHALVLDRVSFRVEPGTTCAILGPSGVGKSTLADLLVRFYDPESGVIRLDGQDLRTLRLADIRRFVVLVDQDTFIFNASVLENIRYGLPGASPAEVEKAARGAAIDERIRQMPQGYETQIGERGQTLSAGERQRITLARALLRDPAVLVLDEPTAALDEATEQEIAQALRDCLRGKTAIIITHRPALATIAQQVVRLENGRAAEIAHGVAR